MSPTPQPDETSLIAEWAWKMVGVFVAFVGGIVSATWAVASKVRGYDDRLKVVETTQGKCQAETLKGISDKLDSLPDKIDKKMDEKLIRIHERIDEALLGRRISDNTPPRPHGMD